MPRTLVTAGQFRYLLGVLKGVLALWCIQGEMAMYDLQLLSIPVIFQTLTILMGPKRDFCQAARVRFDWIGNPLYNLYNVKSISRFEKCDFQELAHALGVPIIFRTPAGDVCGWAEGLLTLLVRLSYPCTWDRVATYLGGRDRTAIGRVFKYMVELCYAFKHKLDDINIWEAHIPTFVDVISATGGAVKGVFGFIDGTFQSICRPTGGLGSTSSGGLQRECYNSHYAGHGLKYQAVVLPNGMFGDLYGTHGFKIYGDSAYSAYAGVGWVEGTVLPIAAPLETPAAA